MGEPNEETVRLVKFRLYGKRMEDLKIIRWIDQLPTNGRGAVNLKQEIITAISKQIDRNRRKDAPPQGKVQRKEKEDGGAQGIAALEEIKEELERDPEPVLTPMERAAQMNF